MADLHLGQSHYPVRQEVRQWERQLRQEVVAAGELHLHRELATFIRSFTTYMVWSYAYTGRSAVDANGNIEVTINILQDGTKRIENVSLSGAASDISDTCAARVTAFANEYEASVALPAIGEEVTVIE